VCTRPTVHGTYGCDKNIRQQRDVDVFRVDVVVSANRVRDKANVGQHGLSHKSFLVRECNRLLP
jgi:hypothetical protein